MKQDFGELVEYLDKKFNVIDGDFAELKSDFSGLKSDFWQLQSAVDSYAAKADKYFMEMVALAHKVDRLERWIQEIADKVGIKLKS